LEIITIVLRTQPSISTQDKAARSAKLATHRRIVSGLRIRGTVPKLSYTSSCAARGQIHLYFHTYASRTEHIYSQTGRLRVKCDGTRAETRFRLSTKRTSPFKLTGASVQSTTGSRGVRISGSNAGYPMFRGSMKGTGYPLHSPVSRSLPLPCVTACHHISTGVHGLLITSS